MRFQHGNSQPDDNSPELVDQFVERDNKIIFRTARPRQWRDVSNGQRYFADHFVHQAQLSRRRARRGRAMECGASPRAALGGKECVSVSAFPSSSPST